MLSMGVKLALSESVTGGQSGRLLGKKESQRRR